MTFAIVLSHIRRLFTPRAKRIAHDRRRLEHLCQAHGVSKSRSIAIARDWIPGDSGCSTNSH